MKVFWCVYVILSRGFWCVLSDEVQFCEDLNTTISDSRNSFYHLCGTDACRVSKERGFK